MAHDGEAGSERSGGLCRGFQNELWEGISLAQLPEEREAGLGHLWVRCGLAQTTVPHGVQPQGRDSWARCLGRPLLLAEGAEGRQLDWLYVCPHVRAQESGGAGGSSGDDGRVGDRGKELCSKRQEKINLLYTEDPGSPKPPTVLGFVSGVGTGRMGMLKLVGLVLTEAAVSPGVRGS